MPGYAGAMSATVPQATTRLRRMPPKELAADAEAARLVARLTRKGSKQSEPVRVAAFNSYI
jgi:hypothetical protein